jgi:hypothetical protein
MEVKCRVSAAERGPCIDVATSYVAGEGAHYLQVTVPQSTKPERIQYYTGIVRNCTIVQYRTIRSFQ